VCVDRRNRSSSILSSSGSPAGRRKWSRLRPLAMTRIRRRRPRPCYRSTASWYPCNHFPLSRQSSPVHTTASFLIIRFSKREEWDSPSLDGHTHRASEKKASSTFVFAFADVSMNDIPSSAASSRPWFSVIIYTKQKRTPYDDKPSCILYLFIGIWMFIKS
jgi:hypothetical protein